MHLATVYSKLGMYGSRLFSKKTRLYFVKSGADDFLSALLHENASYSECFQLISPGKVVIQKWRTWRFLYVDPARGLFGVAPWLRHLNLIEMVKRRKQEYWNIHLLENLERVKI